MTIRSPLQVLSSAVTWVLVLLVRSYQLLISPLLGPTCKYYPSCSSYAVQALRLRGPIVGLWLIAYRLARCNPWSKGGVDDVPPPRSARPRPLESTSQDHP